MKCQLGRDLQVRNASKLNIKNLRDFKAFLCITTTAIMT
jgi:hypothetical protein